MKKLDKTAVVVRQNYIKREKYKAQKWDHEMKPADLQFPQESH